MQPKGTGQILHLTLNMLSRMVYDGNEFSYLSELGINPSIMNRFNDTVCI